MCECIFVYPRFVSIGLCVCVCVCVCLALRLVGTHSLSMIVICVAWQGLAETERRGHTTTLFYSSLLMNVRKFDIIINEH